MSKFVRSDFGSIPGKVGQCIWCLILPDGAASLDPEIAPDCQEEQEYEHDRVDALNDIEMVRTILETYLPRTGKMAASAIAKLEDARARRGEG